MIEGGCIYLAGHLCLLIARMPVCVLGEGGRGAGLHPRWTAVLVYTVIQDDRGWVHIPSRSAVFADIQDDCVLEEGGRLTPRRAAVLVYIQDDKVCVCVCVCVIL